MSDNLPVSSIRISIRIWIDGTNNDFKSKLTLLKNRGGLCFVSDDVNFICECTEKIIENMTRKLNMTRKQITRKFFTCKH